MVEFRSLVINGLLLGIFILAMISGSVYLAIGNDANSTILDNSAINRSFIDLGANLSYESNQNISENALTSFETEDPLEGSDSLLFKSVVGVSRIFTGMWRTMYEIGFNLIFKTLNLSELVIGAIVSILLIIITLSAWSVYRAGR